MNLTGPGFRNTVWGTDCSEGCPEGAGRAEARAPGIDANWPPLSPSQVAHSRTGTQADPHPFAALLPGAQRTRNQGLGRRAPQLCLCRPARSLHLGPKGSPTDGRSRGAHVPPSGLPMRCLISSPSSQELVFFFCQFTMIVSVPLPPPPWGGKGGRQGAACSLFWTDCTT